MDNVIVYCEIEDGKIADVSFELLTKARSLAQAFGCCVEALVIGSEIAGAAREVAQYGASRVYVADDVRLQHYLTLPYERIVCDVFRRERPRVALFGATTVGRDLAPRVSSKLHSGLTADCTMLQVGDYVDAKMGKEYKDLLYQIRPAFGGNIIATIVNPECRPQMATVREGVMRREALEKSVACETVSVDTASVLRAEDFVVSIVDRFIEPKTIDIKGAPIIVAGGYGVGSREGFQQLFDLAHLLGAEVGASRAAVDAGFTDHARQVGQTGVTVRPKLYIACGISGQVQHTAGMGESQMIISINSDPEAPMNRIADYVILGDVREVVGHFIAAYKKNSK